MRLLGPPSSLRLCLHHQRSRRDLTVLGSARKAFTSARRERQPFGDAAFARGSSRNTSLKKAIF
jgi:hypothetical protein